MPRNFLIQEPYIVFLINFLKILNNDQKFLNLPSDFKIHHIIENCPLKTTMRE